MEPDAIAKGSEASRTRWSLALKLAQMCPPELYTELAVTGSTAQGIAREQSDLELNFWLMGAIPPQAQRVAWAREVGLRDVRASDEPRPDQSYWLQAVYLQPDGASIDVELGWQTAADLAHSLEPLLNAATTQHRALRLADLVLTALRLRGGGVLEAWQQRLRDGYPEGLRRQLLAEALARWAHFEQAPAPSEAAFEDALHAYYRAVFAAHRVWEPGWKAALSRLEALERQPQDVRARLEKLLTLDDLTRRVAGLRELMRETKPWL